MVPKNRLRPFSFTKLRRSVAGAAVRAEVAVPVIVATIR
jgi:hypothetical protein